MTAMDPAAPETAPTHAVQRPRWYRRATSRGPFSAAWPGVAARLGLACAVLGAACGEAAAPAPGAVGDGARPVPASMAACNECHAPVVQAFLGHGMSASLGPLDHQPAGAVRVGPGPLYTFGQRTAPDGRVESILSARAPDGGERRSLVVGRYGAGVFDTSYIGTELDPDGRPTGRLSFLPVEHVEGHGLAPSPFEYLTPGFSFDQSFTSECLQCHTTDDPTRLPGAAVDATHDAARTASRPRIWPENHLGADALTQLTPLSCSACHGDGAQHVALQRGSLDAGRPAAALGLQRLSELDAPRQRDVCARCHLQGEGALTLADIGPGGPQPPDFPARRPVLVPATADDDFRFVGQVQRLALSRCLTESAALTCTSCHDPHLAVAAQGTASFDARCLSCHADPADCVRPSDLTVQAVTGAAARTYDGCVDCHVRRSQPFDLDHVRTADHWVRRVIPLPESVPLRAWDDAEAALRVFHDGRLKDALDTEAGRAWEAALSTAGRLRMGPDDAGLAVLNAIDALPAPPAPLPPLTGSADFEHMRGIAHAMDGDEAGARTAYGRALALDPSHPLARLNRAGSRLQAGDVEGALFDAEELLRRYPRAEKPWNLRARVAALAGDHQAAASALIQSVLAWPSDAGVWRDLAKLMEALGRPNEAAAAYERAAVLAPSLPGLDHPGVHRQQSAPPTNDPAGR